MYAPVVSKSSPSGQWGLQMIIALDNLTATSQDTLIHNLPAKHLLDSLIAEIVIVSSFAVLSC